MLRPFWSMTCAEKIERHDPAISTSVLPALFLYTNYLNSIIPNYRAVAKISMRTAQQVYIPPVTDDSGRGVFGETDLYLLETTGERK
jgi:hypothetical protein